MGKRITIATSSFRKSRLISNVLIFDSDPLLWDAFCENAKVKETRKPLRFYIGNLKAIEDVSREPILYTKAKHIKRELKGFTTTIAFNQARIEYLMALPDDMRVYFAMDEFRFYKRKRK